MNNPRIFWWIIAAVVAIIWLPHLLAQGMFMDGVYDALLAENLHKGISTFWAPQTIYYSQPAYWDNPPLAMGALAACYKFFGDHYWVERAYSFVCALLQLGLIAALWKSLFNNSEAARQTAWLPCLLWLISPLTGWCYSNNLLENTMSLFTTYAIIVSLQYVRTQKRLVASSFTVALLLLLAFITKGPTSLFPLALPVLFIGYNENFKIKRALAASVLQACFFVVLFVALFSFEAPHNFFVNYFQVQVKRALTHNMPGQYKPYSIFIDLLISLLPFIILSFLAMLFNKSGEGKDRINKTIWWRFILLGLCGSVPIMLSIKQRKFYLLPALTPFVIGFAALLYPLFKNLLDRINTKAEATFSTLVRIGAALVIMIALFQSYQNQGLMVRDKDLLTDLAMLDKATPNQNVLRADWHLYDQWAMRGYLLRLYGKKIAMPDEGAVSHYYITMPNEGGDGLPQNAKKIFTGKTLDLYQLAD